MLPFPRIVAWLAVAGAAVGAPAAPPPLKLTAEAVPCGPSATFHEDGGLHTCTLTAPFALGDATLPEGSRLVLDPRGVLMHAFLSRDTRIAGHLCRGKGHGFMTGFHADGSLRLCWLAGPEEIDGIPCDDTSVPGEIVRGLAGRANGSVTLHDNGRLESCRLARDHVLGEREFRRGERILLDRDGNLRRP